MSVISLTSVKLDLRVDGTDDDALLQLHIDAAEDEAARFCGRDELPTLPYDLPASSDSEDVPSTEDPVAPSVRAAVFLLVRSKYDATSPDEIAGLRRAAESLLMPYRTGLGM